MTSSELEKIAKEILQCNHYLEGRVHDQHIAKIAKEGADDAIEIYKDQLMLKLMNAGLILEDYE